MRFRWMFALLVATAALSPAAAQRSDNERGGVRTETQERLAGTIDYHFFVNVIGLLGLFGLLGLRPAHADDSYHPAPLE